MMDNVVGKNAPLGQGVISLNQACGNQPSGFTVPIYHNGREYGVVSGFVHVTNLVSVAGELASIRKLAEQHDPSLNQSPSSAPSALTGLGGL